MWLHNATDEVLCILCTMLPSWMTGFRASEQGASDQEKLCVLFTNVNHPSADLKHWPHSVHDCSSSRTESCGTKEILVHLHAIWISSTFLFLHNLVPDVEGFGNTAVKHSKQQINRKKCGVHATLACVACVLPEVLLDTDRSTCCDDACLVMAS